MSTINIKYVGQKFDTVMGSAIREGTYFMGTPEHGLYDAHLKTSTQEIIQLRTGKAYPFDTRIMNYEECNVEITIIPKFG